MSEAANIGVSKEEISEDIPKSSERKKGKFSDIVQFTKLRLASLVVLSAAISYLTGAKNVDSEMLTMLILGGFLVTASSNGFNQILERHLDKLMSRTQNRPLPSFSMTVAEALIISFAFGVSGLAVLYIWHGLSCFLLGLFALLSYVLVYTPLKQKTPFAVFVGAFPGAIPPLLGYVAATGRFDVAAWILFAIQFIWQFPHFWAIAWVLDDDYKKAGFRMLPSNGGRDKNSAFQVLVYTAALIPMSFLPYMFKLSGPASVTINIILGILFFIQAIKLFKDCSLKSAKQLMFGSFIYLPLAQLAIYLDKY